MKIPSDILLQEQMVEKLRTVKLRCFLTLDSMNYQFICFQNALKNWRQFALAVFAN